MYNELSFPTAANIDLQHWASKEPATAAVSLHGTKRAMLGAHEARRSATVKMYGTPAPQYFQTIHNGVPHTLTAAPCQASAEVRG
jgi:hypothetical protein